jgi:phage recombination protein Bet
VEVLKGNVCKGATDAELATFLEVCKAKRLDPFSKQIHAVKRWTKDHGEVWSYQIGIDGFRAIADRTGERDGEEGPYWCGDDGKWHDLWLDKKPPRAARMLVFRKGVSRPYKGLAQWDFYCQCKKGGAPNLMWEKGGPHMLAKCAEALALRKAFPEDLSGVALPEEMGQAENDYPNTIDAEFTSTEVLEPEVIDESPIDDLLDDMSKAATMAELDALIPRCRNLEGEEREHALTTYRARKRASAVLPQSPRDEPGEPAERGTVIHAFLEDCSLAGREAALRVVPEKYHDACEAIDTEALPTELDHEVAFAYDWQAGTARYLGRGLNREYGKLGETEIPITLDVFGVHSESLLCYDGDYKTGWGDVTEAKHNPQLRLGMLAACRHYGRDGGVIEILRVREGSVWRDTATIDEFDLAEEAARCKKTMEESHSLKLAFDSGMIPGEADVNPGTHCTYCRSFDYCPAQQQLAVEVLDGNLALEVESAWAGALTAESAPEAYRKFKQAKVLVKRMSDILHAYAKKHPIELGNGKVFGEREKRGNEKLDGGTAYAQMLRLYGRVAADASTKKTTTKKALREALRPIEDEDSLAVREKKVLAAIREAGGSKRTSSKKVEEYKR